MSSQQVIAAHVLTRVRFSSDWQELTILIPRTQLDLEYWGEGIARNRVTAVANKLGFNGRTRFLGWITDEREYQKTNQ